MNFANVKLILCREVRDQARDRRTLFMIAVLPLLLYPLLGVSLLQVAQFTQHQSTRVLVVGAPHLDNLPPLFENQRFSGALFAGRDTADLLDLVFAPGEAGKGGPDRLGPRAAAQAQVEAGSYEAALYFPADFAARLQAFRLAVHHAVEGRAKRGLGCEPTAPPKIPSPEIIYTTANERSQVAYVRLSGVLQRWTAVIGDENLAASGVSVRAIHPFALESADLAGASGHQGAALWSKTLPVLLLLWALTGAFYPAVDLCAGEKERGTLETLLSSPAQRSEIVFGKLLTVMLFSIVTTVLNLLSMAITGWIVLSNLQAVGLPPLAAMAALGVALLPIAALFSAVCLAVAAFARSTKEGQYYLMPVLMLTMPLVVLPMSPGVELNLGNSLIPVTGVVLLLRCILEGDYWRALQFSPMVAAVTLAACWAAVRWAVEQFNSEAVLFRESERLDLGLRLRRLLRDRPATPTLAAAVCCGVAILIARFFFSSAFPPASGFSGFVRLALTTQLLVIAAPALLLTFTLTRNPRQTLLLKRPAWLAVPAAAALAVVLHPASSVLQSVVSEIYPVSDQLRPAMQVVEEMFRSANLGTLILVIGLAPAVCEELAFRGFILSGFRRLGYKWRAIVYSALFFGLAHGILQQSLIACMLGVILAYLAVQSGSLVPGIVFHVVHNSLVLIDSRLTAEAFSRWPALRLLASPGEGGGCVFHWPVVAFGALLALAPLAWFALQRPAPLGEEVPPQAIARPAGGDQSLAAVG